MIPINRIWYSAGAGIALFPLFFALTSAGREYTGSGFRNRMLGIGAACLIGALMAYAAGSRRKWIRWTALLLLFGPPIAFLALLAWIFTFPPLS
jgi:hypothetical protein